MLWCLHISFRNKKVVWLWFDLYRERYIDWYEKKNDRVVKIFPLSPSPRGNTCTYSPLSAQKAAHCTWKKAPCSTPNMVCKMRLKKSKRMKLHWAKALLYLIIWKFLPTGFLWRPIEKGQSSETIEKGQIFEWFMEHNALVCTIFLEMEKDWLLIYCLVAHVLYLPQNLFLLPHQPCGYVRVCLENWPHLQSMLEVHSK